MAYCRDDCIAYEFCIAACKLGIQKVEHTERLDNIAINEDFAFSDLRPSKVINPKRSWRRVIVKLMKISWADAQMPTTKKTRWEIFLSIFPH